MAETHDPNHPYVRRLVGCGHGVLFSAYCRDCEIVGLHDSYNRAVSTVATVRDRLRVLGAPMQGNTSGGRLRQGDSIVTGARDVDQRVPVPAAGAPEVGAQLVNLRGDGLKHDHKAAVPTSPHEPDATP